MTRDEMERLTAHTDNKSEKIRILYRAGVERADIHRFLGITYQHVQNVLKRSGLLEAPPGGGAKEAVGSGKVYTVTAAKGGKIVLPQDYLDSQQIVEGQTLICREERGGLLIMSQAAATDMLREIARHRMPGEAALLEALLGPTKTS